MGAQRHRRLVASLWSPALKLASRSRTLVRHVAEADWVGDDLAIVTRGHRFAIHENHHAGAELRVVNERITGASSYHRV